MSAWLSEDERIFLANAELMLKKRELIEKINVQLESLGQSLVRWTSDLPRIPNEVISVKPKISRGENYKGLPYLVLDYPRSYEKDNVLAFRVMIWWGKHVSAFMHLKGKYWLDCQTQISLLTPQKPLLQAIGNNEWEQENSVENFGPLIPSSLVHNKQVYLKIGRFMEISNAHQLDEFVFDTWQDTMVATFGELEANDCK